MTLKQKALYNKSDWLIIIIYFGISILVTLFDISSSKMTKYILEQSVYIIFSIVPITLLLKYVFPITIERGKYFMFFVYTFLVFFILGFMERYCYKLIYSAKWNMFTLDSLLYGIVSQAQNVGMLLAILIAKRLFEANLDISNLEKEKKTNELRMLNSQIDPHFLFNNLNTVDNLIDTDPKGAKKYLNQLAKLYRYLISTKDEELVLLGDEMEFAKNYIYLIEKRFGSAFIFNTGLNEDLLSTTFVPPGSIQGLLENAVKHNRGSNENPIVISILSNMEYIIVSNNVNKRVSQIETTGSGLANINARYKLIYGKEIQIHSDVNFEVKLPIIYQSEN